MSFKKILIAVDSGPIAARAFDLGTVLAKEVGADLGLITVVDSIRMAAPNVDAAALQLLPLAREEARQLLDTLVSKSDGKAKDFLAEGSPGDEIVSAAKSFGADLIVIGSHGRSGLGRVLMGSVAEAVMRHAPCPVLVVRAGA
jgi:nucleotide-binding universal stress UspA family protein